MSDRNRHTGSYSAAEIEKYLQGKLSPGEMHAIEKAALDDPMLADAIEGMSIALEKKDSASVTRDLNELHQRLRRRIESDKAKSIAPISYRYWLQTAAVLFVLVIGGVMAYYAIQKNTKIENSIAKEVKASQTKTDSSKQESFAPVVTANDTPSVSMRKEDRSADKKIIEKGKKSPPPIPGPAKKDNDASGAAAKVEQKPEAERESPLQSAVGDSTADEKNVPASGARRADFYSPQRPGSFMGKVTDEHNNPIASARIELKNKKIAAVTDYNGNFRINTSDHDSIVAANVNSVGYEPAISELSSNGAPNIIILREHKAGLQEVVVSGTGRNKKSNPVQQTSQDAVPVNGWDDYTKYLDKNKKRPDDSVGLKGPVVVSFSVNKKGKLSNFVIEQSLGPDYDEEAIRLIREGPSWKLLKEKAATVKVVVSF